MVQFLVILVAPFVFFKGLIVAQIMATDFAWHHSSFPPFQLLDHVFYNFRSYFLCSIIPLSFSPRYPVCHVPMMGTHGLSRAFHGDTIAFYILQRQHGMEQFVI